ncbi:META domain-containing protein [Dehalogenimonas alkenigignens]|uniref:META domain-containing protein n=1 Tax=Dehalogenimonas alkenigignens TaxID=1217799 RepID=UPI0014021C82|nr:META domain-containing protein [Dehalogenimonas alkenigignens]
MLSILGVQPQRLRLQPPYYVGARYESVLDYQIGCTIIEIMKVGWRQALGAVVTIFMLVNVAACGLAGGDLSLENRTWTLAKYVIDGDLRTFQWFAKITAEFSPGEDIVRGSGGCNRYGGEYETTGSGRLIIDNIVATDLGCLGPRQGQEKDFFNLLGKAVGFQIKGRTLTITCSNGELIFYS